MDIGLTILKIRKLLFGLLHDRMRGALAKGVAASIEHSNALSGLKPNVVLDVGANRGQFALFARHCWPQALVVSFEPLPGPAKLWRAVMAGDARARLVTAAVGATRAKMTVNVTTEDDSSSLLPLGSKHKSLYHSAVVSHVETTVAPLPDFVTEEDLQGEILLKIDTQGFELEVLKGCRSLFNRISYIYAELSFVELYDSQPLASEIICYLNDAGFELIGIYNLSADGKGTQIQADMLFKRRA